jgi:D-amino-acid dehydrogenase
MLTKLRQVEAFEDAMKTIVMGGGIIGVTTAWYLAEAGHDVTILERREDTGLETSFQNGALLAPGHSQAWASPSAPVTLLKSLFQDDPPLRFRLRPEFSYWRWCLEFLRNCTSERYRANTLRTLRIMIYGVEQLRALRDRIGITYDGNDKGILYLFRSQESFEKGVAAWNLLREHGLLLETVDREACIKIEPALKASQDKIAGGLFAPTDAAGDALMFTRNLAKLAEAKGVKLRLKTTVTGIEREGDRVARVITDQGPLSGDCYVLALGLHSPDLARTVGIHLPVYPIKGYTVTIPTDGYPEAPTVGIIEEDNLVAFARLGNRLRAGGKAEFAGYDKSYTPAQFKGVFKVSRDLFPHGGDYSKPTYYACLRPVTPRGPPILGPTRYRNLFVNVGHGAAGWTQACGACRLVVDMMLGNKPEIDTEGLTLPR